MRLADPGWAQQDDVLGALDEGAPGEIAQLTLVD